MGQPLSPPPRTQSPQPVAHSLALQQGRSSAITPDTHRWAAPPSPWVQSDSLTDGLCPCPGGTVNVTPGTHQSAILMGKDSAPHGRGVSSLGGWSGLGLTCPPLPQRLANPHPREIPCFYGCLCASCLGWHWACTLAGSSPSPWPWKTSRPGSWSLSCASGAWPSPAGTAS